MTNQLVNSPQNKPPPAMSWFTNIWEINSLLSTEDEADPWEEQQVAGELEGRTLDLPALAVMAEHLYTGFRPTGTIQSENEDWMDR